MINRELGGIDTRAGDGCDAASRHRRRPRLRSGHFKSSIGPRRGRVGVDGDALERVTAHDAIALELGVNVEAPDVGHGVPCGSAPRVCARRRE